MASTIKIPTEFIAVDKFSSVVSKMTAGVSNFSKSTSSAVERFNAKANKVANSLAVAGTAMVAPMGIALNSAIQFEDKMADVAKTTGLSEKESESYGKAILDMSKKTRTSISSLQDIGVVAGTIGVAKDELVAFTKAGNQFAIALGSDFGSTEFAVEQVAKLKNLFKETRGIDIATSMTKAGSAINEVSNSAGSAKNINDFMLRIGALPDAMKPTIQQSAALGGFLEDAGLSAEIAAGGFSNLILVAGKNMSGFATQMGMTVQSANKLYSTDPTKFATTFAKSLNKLKPRELAMTLDSLKIGSQETIKVVGALGSGYEKLGKVQDISNKAFSDGISISQEADKKNQTMAGRMAMAKNNIEALTISVGQNLAPALEKIIPQITKLVDKIGAFIESNPNLIKNLPLIAGALFAMSFAIRAVTLSTSIASGVMTAYTSVMTWYSGVAVTAALTGASFASVVWATISPVLLVIAAIAAIIAIFYYWDEIVAWFSKQWETFTNWIGVLWDGLVSWFQNFSFVDFFMKIGQSIVDFMLFPLRSVLELISKIPGKIGEMAKTGLAQLDNINLTQKLESPDVTKQNNAANNTINGKVDVNVSAKGGATAETSSKSKGGIPVRTTSTQGAF